jgi:hypothetical protein
MQMEMHLRSLVLLYRRALGEARVTEIAAGWDTTVISVVVAVESLLFPALLASSRAPPRMLVPHNLKPPVGGTAGLMLAVVKKHVERDWEGEQQQEQQQSLYDLNNEQHARWLSAAEAASQTLRLLSQTYEAPNGSLLLQGRWSTDQPCRSAHSACCVLSCRVTVCS